MSSDSPVRASSLDRPAIVRAALDLLDDVGFDGLSTRRLADALGIKGPSLYWHFRNMRELYDHMAEAMLEQALPAPEAYPGDWEAWLGAGARNIRRVALSRRDGARILAGARPTGTSTVLSFPHMVARLEREGFSRADATASLRALGRYAVGWVLDEQMAMRAPEESEPFFEFGLKAMLAGIAQKRQT
ncbi:TetR/AcrR family transcriptional regulator C-terminal domain-containing protein [Phenylobacterium sp. J367]|uniref:TetR/AcrR family transcriptional regulator C-terminal domain-containing protein n=1 Tax=Phenylobacterium sp. J367 TaxID=2898435 RepID=UPI002150AA8A|nr:TetR/AcrR family transcriptional regulator C-terminal domain-containing protein [Phenylobacterium sp. J367]MCR5877267.1 TetR/AcrR family transcriptional regulator C-terminal domain-containing protein [Phenylobacterium sp. J367]